MKKKKWLAVLSSLLLSSSLMACQSVETEATKPAGNPVQAEENNQEKEISQVVEKETSPTVSQEGVQKETVKKEAVSEFQSIGDLKVYYLDVGQGDSIYIQTPKGDDILIDGGNNDKGDEVVSYLQKYDVDDIEVMIATHPDADHIGGLDNVLEEMSVESVYMPKITHTTDTFEDFILAVQNEGLKVKEAKAGVELGLGGIEATFLAPVKSYGDDLNTSSAVLKIVYGENRFLFTGDATIEAEEDMIASGVDLQADVLKLGHHGANTSTSKTFLSKVNPKYGVISVGEGNRYGHPTEETLQRLKEHGVKVERTDKQGTILAVSDGKHIAFKYEPSLLIKEKPESTGTVAPTPSTTVTTSEPKTSDASIQASVDNPNPNQYETIQLSVTGATGAPYTAVLHYKSKDTTYTGTVGTPLPIKISRASAGFEVFIDIIVQVNGKEVQTQTSFIPQ